MADLFAVIVAVAVFILIAVIAIKTRQRNGGFRRPGAGAIGSVYDMLNQDKRNAVELIVEQRAEERTLEHEDDIVDDPIK